jgi:hypothetical protein
MEIEDTCAMPDDDGKAETNYKLLTSSTLYQCGDRADGGQNNEYGRMTEPMRVGRSGRDMFRGSILHSVQTELRH